MAHILYGTSKGNIFNHDHNLQFQHNDPFLHHNEDDRARDPIRPFVCIRWYTGRWWNVKV